MAKLPLLLLGYFWLTLQDFSCQLRAKTFSQSHSVFKWQKGIKKRLKTAEDSYLTLSWQQCSQYMGNF